MFIRHDEDEDIEEKENEKNIIFNLALSSMNQFHFGSP